jgi:RNA polymerase sigma factor (sigma-70 family)
VEASTLRSSASVARPRVALGSPLLRLRSDEQLVELFRGGSEEAFRAIHDRYHKRLFAYARQMLPGRQDAEDALQDVFVRAYSGLQTSDRELALRAWLFRIAHNRCVDELRKPTPPPPEVLQLVRTTVHDPLVELEIRDSLRRLVEDIRRLPDQQRSALLMRELGGMSYAELSTSLGISVGAVKSLLVRARIALAEAAEARDTACGVIRDQLVEAHDRGVRPNANARKHMRDCVGCKAYRRELRGVSRQLAAMTPALGPVGVLAKLLGFSGGAGGGAAGGAGGSAALFGGSGATASAGGLALGANHVATLLIAAVATAGGAVEIQRTIMHPSRPATVRAAPAQRIQPTGANGLPYQATRDDDTHVIPGVIAASRPVTTKPAASGVSASAKPATLRHPRHAGDAARLKKATAKVPSGGMVIGGDLPSSSTTIPISTTTTSTELSASCPPAATTNAPAGQSSTSGSAAPTDTAGGTAPADSTASSPSTTTSTAPTSCGASAGSSAQAPASSSGTSTTTGSATSPGAGSTSTGSDPNAATGPASSTTATGSGSSTASSRSGSTSGAGSSPGATTSPSNSATTTG